MGERELRHARKSEAAFRDYVRETAATGGSGGGTGGSADELTKLAELKNHGDLTVDEYERAKAKVLTAV
ncbi:SHOCT domain-containing protein [Streptomyces sp. R21]|uniref:SHOCT domain-containing protein n=1 Tax=Streptomyces sp. R21 TaxID=3238627 RepID=A0AB39P1S3_9ACTN